MIPQDFLQRLLTGGYLPFFGTEAAEEAIENVQQASAVHGLLQHPKLPPRYCVCGKQEINGSQAYLSCSGKDYCKSPDCMEALSKDIEPFVESFYVKEKRKK